MTYILSPTYDDHSYVDAYVDDISLLVGLRLRSGDVLSGAFPEQLRITVEPHSGISDFFWIGSLTVVSNRFRELATSWNVRAEWFPVKVANKAGILTGYAFMNLLDSVDRLDRNESVFTLRKDIASHLQRIVLKPVVDEPPLYLLAKATPFLFCARDDFADELRLSGMAGCVLERDSDWRPEALPRQ